MAGLDFWFSGSNGHISETKRAMEDPLVEKLPNGRSAGGKMTTFLRAEGPPVRISDPERPPDF